MLHFENNFLCCTSTVIYASIIYERVYYTFNMTVYLIEQRVRDVFKWLVRLTYMKMTIWNQFIIMIDADDTKQMNLF